ncbi:tetratricopeptide repeat protein, partial [Flavobacterium hauense]
MFLQLSYSQTPGIDIVKKNRQIRRTITSEPDSARVYIKEILAYKGKLHDTVYCSTFMSYAYYHHLKNSTDSALYYYNKAATFADRQKFPKIYARLLRNKAGTYKKRGENEEALELLDIVEDIYKSTSDETGLALVYGEIASNNNLLLRRDEGIRYLLKAIEILEKQNNKEYILSIKSSLANAYLDTGNLEFAADLYKEILKGYKELNLVKNYSIVLINYGDCLTRQKKYPEAQKILNEALPGLKKFNDQEIIGVVYSKLGIIKRETNHLKESEILYRTAFQKVLTNNSPRIISIGSEYLDVLNQQNKTEEALSIIEQIDKTEFLEKANIHDRVYFENLKAEIFQKANKTDKALLSIQNSLKLQDTLKKSGTGMTTVKLQQEYQNKYQAERTESLKNTNSSLKQEINESRKNILFPLGICLFVLVLAFIYVNNLKRHKTKLMLAKTKKEQLLREYENTKNLNKINRQNLEHKKEELVSGIVSLTTLEGNISRLITLCKENPENLCINTIKDQLVSLTSDKDYWTLFRKRFSENYAGFQNNLESSYPTLSKNDLFFCALLKLNLPYKDMATLM